MRTLTQSEIDIACDKMRQTGTRLLKALPQELPTADGIAIAFCLASSVWAALQELPDPPEEVKRLIIACDNICHESARYMALNPLPVSFVLPESVE